jgi:hypothetical protein
MNKTPSIECEACNVKGRLYPGKDEVGHSALFLRLKGVTAIDEENNEYECSLSAVSAAPIISCKQTGRKVVFDWESLINAAKGMGIHELDGAFEKFKK